MDDQRLGQRALHRMAGMERAIGVLENQLQRAAAFPRRQRRDRRAVEVQRPAGDGLESGDGAQQRRFARTGFADDAERRARGDGEGDAADHLAPAEAHDKIVRSDHGVPSNRAAAARRRRV